MLIDRLGFRRHDPGLSLLLEEVGMLQCGLRILDAVPDEQRIHCRFEEESADLGELSLSLLEVELLRADSGLDGLKFDDGP